MFVRVTAAPQVGADMDRLREERQQAALDLARVRKEQLELAGKVASATQQLDKVREAEGAWLRWLAGWCPARGSWARCAGRGSKQVKMCGQQQRQWSTGPRSFLVVNQRWMTWCCGRGGDQGHCSRCRQRMSEMTVLVGRPCFNHAVAFIYCVSGACGMPHAPGCCRAAHFRCRGPSTCHSLPRAACPLLRLCR